MPSTAASKVVDEVERTDHDSGCRGDENSSSRRGPAGAAPADLLVQIPAH